LGGKFCAVLCVLNYFTFSENIHTMVFLRHRRGDLLGFEREVGPDMRLTTAVEMLGERRTISGHRLLMPGLGLSLAIRQRWKEEHCCHFPNQYILFYASLIFSTTQSLKNIGT
jgi:hypothetical protein